MLDVGQLAVVASEDQIGASLPRCGQKLTGDRRLRLLSAAAGHGTGPIALHPERMVQHRMLLRPLLPPGGSPHLNRGLSVMERQ